MQLVRLAPRGLPARSHAAGDAVVLTILRYSTGFHEYFGSRIHTPPGGVAPKQRVLHEFHNRALITSQNHSLLMIGRRRICGLAEQSTKTRRRGITPRKKLSRQYHGGSNLWVGNLEHASFTFKSGKGPDLANANVGTTTSDVPDGLGQYADTQDAFISNLTGWVDNDMANWGYSGAVDQTTGTTACRPAWWAARIVAHVAWSMTPETTPDCEAG